MKLSAMIGMLQDLQRNVTQQYGEDFDPEVDVISHVNDAVAEGANEPLGGKGELAKRSFCNSELLIEPCE